MIFLRLWWHFVTNEGGWRYPRFAVRALYQSGRVAFYLWLRS